MYPYYTLITKMDEIDPEISYTFTTEGSLVGDFNRLVVSTTQHTAGFLLAHVAEQIAKMTVAIDYGSAKSNCDVGVFYKLGAGDVAFVADDHLRADFAMEFAGYLLESVKFK
jgi:hypothetical protein